MIDKLLKIKKILHLIGQNLLGKEIELKLKAENLVNELIIDVQQKNIFDKNKRIDKPATRQIIKL